MTFCELNKEEFELFLSNHPLKSFVQTSIITDYKKKLGFNVLYVGLKENKKIICATMLLSKDNVFYSPNGYLIDFYDYDLLKYFTKKIKKYIKKKHGYILIIDPYLPIKKLDNSLNIIEDNTHLISSLENLGYIYKGSTNQVKYMYVLDLNKDVYKNMKDSTKNCIKKSMRKGIIFRDLLYEELPIFKNITLMSSKEHNYIDKELSYYEEMYNKDNVRFVVCEIDFKEYLKGIKEEINNLKKSKDYLDRLNSLNKQIIEINNRNDKVIVSVAMFILYGDEVIYLFSGNDKKYINFNTSYRIQWEMIKYAKEHNYKRYNFYGFNDTNDSIFKFKKGFNGYIIELIGELELPINMFYYIKKVLKMIFF